jgi:hypothetical protein
MDDPFPNCIEIPLESLSGSLTAPMISHCTIGVNVFVASHNLRKSETNPSGYGNACLTFSKPWQRTVTTCVDRPRGRRKTAFDQYLSRTLAAFIKIGLTTRFAHQGGSRQIGCAPTKI